MARIVFDLDGTLIDSAADVQGIANSLLAPRGAPPLTLAQARAFMGEGTPTFVTRMMRARGLDLAGFEAMHAAFLARYTAAVTHTTIYPDVIDTLHILAAAGHRLGLCTNKPLAPARAILTHLGLWTHFDVVIGGDSLATRKPDPAMLHAALDALGDSPALYIGDSETDCETASAANVPFILFTEGYPKGPPDSIPCAARFAAFADLPALVAART